MFGISQNSANYKTNPENYSYCDQSSDPQSIHNEPDWNKLNNDHTNTTDETPQNDLEYTEQPQENFYENENFPETSPGPQIT